jgi:hypothetical protein
MIGKCLELVAKLPSTDSLLIDCEFLDLLAVLGEELLKRGHMCTFSKRLQFCRDKITSDQCQKLNKTQTVVKQLFDQGISGQAFIDELKSHGLLDYKGSAEAVASALEQPGADQLLGVIGALVDSQRGPSSTSNYAKQR